MAFDRKRWAKAYYKKHKARRAKENRDRAKAWYWANRVRACLNAATWRKKNVAYRVAYDKKYGARNRERIAARAKAYRIRRATEIKAHKAAYYQRNRAKILLKMIPRRAANRAEHRDYMKAYYHANKDKFFANAALRRAKLKGAIVDYAGVPAFYRKVRTAAKIRCHWCGKFIPKGRRSVDHLVPISRGGEHSLKNIVAACIPCNCSKNAKSVAEFKQWRKATRAA